MRIEVADREARLQVLKQKSKQKLKDLDIKLIEKDSEPSAKLDHINLFADLEHSVTTTNKEHDLEVKEKKEEYEKKIGYLTYLGQDTNEANKKKNWYEVLPEASKFSRSSDIKETYDKLVLKDLDGKPKNRELDVKDGEVYWKTKQKLDPINAFKKFCSQKNKSDKSSPVHVKKSLKEQKKAPKGKNDDKLKKLEKLREARLKREQQERHKTEMFLKKLSGSDTPNEDQPKPTIVIAKYNSQFNPELARQNYY